MNFLYLTVKSTIFDIALVLKSMGHSVTVIDHHQFDPVLPDFREPYIPVEEELTAKSFDYAITFLYLPILSDLCQKYNVPYISWVYDSPSVSVFHETIFNLVNRIFIFDQAFCNRLIQIGIPHVYYMPLAANTTRINNHAFTAEDMQRYSGDISFVGKLYEQNAYSLFAKELPDELLVPLNYYLMHNLCNWKEVRQWPLLTPECTEIFSAKESPFYPTLQHFQMPANLYLGTHFLCRKLGEMERITALSTLAEDFQVELYSNSKSDLLPGNVKFHPSVHYYMELGCVYHFSKINLCFTLPSIETGVPLRVFDIMAYGGFVLSNYQQEFSSLFEIGKDLAVFHDLTELKEQAHYYLTHEEERITIAAHGYQTVNRLYSYEHQLNRIFQICEELTD